jgi:outer membrane protein OmpA-like peptidoglycan-associated protein
VYNGPRVDHSPPEEAEKPFWISYADLMTSLMVLFLVVMLASLVTLTRTVTDLQDTQSRSEVLAAKYKDLKRSEARRERLQGRRRAEIDRFWTALEKSNRGLGIRVDRDRQVIDFGSRARFASARDELSSSDQLLLRRFAPRLVGLADSDLGRRVLGRVIVEGYADRRGSYLFNLNLSLNRSQRVLCALLASGGRAALSAAEQRRVRDLFLVGGFSFNSSRRSLAASRRVEVRLEFLPLKGKRKRAPAATTAFGKCSLGA